MGAHKLSTTQAGDHDHPVGAMVGPALEEVGVRSTGGNLFGVLSAPTHAFPSLSRYFPVGALITLSASCFETHFIAFAISAISSGLIFLPFESIALIACFARPYFSRA